MRSVSVWPDIFSPWSPSSAVTRPLWSYPPNAPWVYPVAALQTSTRIELQPQPVLVLVQTGCNWFKLHNNTGAGWFLFSIGAACVFLTFFPQYFLEMWSWIRTPAFTITPVLTSVSFFQFRDIVSVLSGWCSLKPLPLPVVLPPASWIILTASPTVVQLSTQGDIRPSLSSIQCGCFPPPPPLVASSVPWPTLSLQAPVTPSCWMVDPVDLHPLSLFDYLFIYIHLLVPAPSPESGDVMVPTLPLPLSSREWVRRGWRLKRCVRTGRVNEATPQPNVMLGTLLPRYEGHTKRAASLGTAPWSLGPSVVLNKPAACWPCRHWFYVRSCFKAAGVTGISAAAWYPALTPTLQVWMSTINTTDV